MKYLLIGIGGVYNYGCEAIVRGTVNIIQNFDNDAVVIYASPVVEYDRKVLRDCPVKLIKRRLIPKYSIKNIIRKIARRCHLDIPLLEDNPKDILQLAPDYVLSIGGDIYTLNAQGKGYPASLVKLGDFCEQNKIRYILWGASVGPFSKDPVAEKKVQKHLQNINGITAREEKTIQYLNSLKINRLVIDCADPAFAVMPALQKSKYSFNPVKLRIAVNFSPLSTLHTGYMRSEMIKKQSEWLSKLLKDYKAEVLLVPHVCTLPPYNLNDDDFFYLKEIHQQLPVAQQAAVRILPQYLGFIKTKQELINCDLCIAARMHCAINAMTALVPTFLLSYSAKAIGMAERVYGQSSGFVYPLTALEQIKPMEYQTLLKVHERLKRKIPELTEFAFSASAIFKGDN